MTSKGSQLVGGGSHLPGIFSSIKLHKLLNFWGEIFLVNLRDFSEKPRAVLQFWAGINMYKLHLGQASQPLNFKLLGIAYLV